MEKYIFSLLFVFMTILHSYFESIRASYKPCKRNVNKYSNNNIAFFLNLDFIICALTFPKARLLPSSVLVFSCQPMSNKLT